MNYGSSNNVLSLDKGIFCISIEFIGSASEYGLAEPVDSVLFL